MNWVFDTYSSVYNTAMMHDVRPGQHAPVARKHKVRDAIVRIFGRG